MKTLAKYFHVVIFFVLLFFVFLLQISPIGTGWPMPLGGKSRSGLAEHLLRICANGMPCIVVLGLCMIPLAMNRSAQCPFHRCSY